MGRKSIKIIPNKVFYTLWMDTECSSLGIYINKYTSPYSKDRISFFNKYGLNPNEVNTMLKSIYIQKTKTIKELLEEANVKKADISKIFCIPIRTVEDWYAEKNRCPLYIKLMIVKEFRLLDLGKYIYLESEIEYKKRKKPVYIKVHQEPKTIISVTKPDKDKTKPVFLYDSYDKKREYLPYEDYLRRKRLEREGKL